MGKIIENYSIQEQLGEGVYGKVYKATHVVTKQQVAIKVIHADKFKQIPKLQECTVNQINILSTMQHCPYIVKYIDMLKTVNNFYFVYEFCNGGTLDKLMQKEGPFSQKRALIYFRQMVEAFKILSKNNIMHRDLKPDNILMHNGIIKLGDFGFCKPMQSANQLANTMLGSPIYMAPQVLKGEVYNMKADIWSLGVVLYQMLFGKCPFQSKSIAKLIKLLDQQDFKIPQNSKLSQTVQKLLKRMLVKDFNQRIDWNELFQFVITEAGQIYPPKNDQNLSNSVNQFQLRSSLRSPLNYMGVSSSNSSNSSNNLYTDNLNSSHNGSLKATQNGSQYGSQNSGVTSPKINKSFDMSDFQQSSKAMMMKKRSPLKEQQLMSPPPTEFRNSTAYNYKNDLYGKNDRTGKLDIWIKNHGKCNQINQIALDLLRSEKAGSLPIAFLLFKNVQKQLGTINQNLKKEPLDYRSDNEATKQLKNIVQKQVQILRQTIKDFRESLIEQENVNPEELQLNLKPKIMKAYFESIKIDCKDEELILAGQVVDYLEQQMLIKKQAYERFGKDNLFKQVKQKYSKFGVF